MLKVISYSNPEETTVDLLIGICGKIEDAEVVTHVHVNQFCNLEANAEAKEEVETVAGSDGCSKIVCRCGNLLIEIVDIGGGTTEVAVISLRRNRSF